MGEWIQFLRGCRHALSSLVSLAGDPQILKPLSAPILFTGLTGLLVLAMPAVLTMRTRRSESRLRAMLDTMLDPHVVLRALRDRDGQINDFMFLEANPLACVFYQLPHERLIGRSLSELQPACQRTDLFQTSIRVVETGQPLIHDNWMDPRDLLGGSQRRYDLRAVKLGDGISQTWRDVTDRSEAQERLRAASERFHLLATNSIDILLLLDDQGIIHWVSPSIATLGFSAADWLDRPVGECLGPENHQELQRQVRTISSRPSITARLRLADRKGVRHWMESQLSSFVVSEGTADGLLLSLRLIDDRRAMERLLDQEIQCKLLDSQRLAAYVEEIAAVGSWKLDHASGQLRGSLQFHRCMALGEPGAALDLSQFLAAIQPEDRGRFQAALEQARGSGQAFEEHVRVPISGQSLRPVVIRGVTHLDASARICITEGTVRDVSELENLRSELEKRQWLDPTTGLPNRAATLRQIQQLIAAAEEQPLVIINLAIDNFQGLNETFGSEHCTHLLCRMGDALRRQLHDADWLAQTARDEFVVIRDGIASIGGSRDLAQQLQQGLATFDLQGDGHHMGIPVSIGVSLWPAHASSAEGLLQAANTALTEAKRRGPRQLQLYSSHISEQIQKRIQMELALGRSLSAEQLSIVYQPQVNSQGLIIAAEALLRWRGNDGVVISPATFIPIAEETGLIQPIGEWVIESCFRQLAQWRDAGLPKLPLSINLSPVQLEDPSGRLSRFVLECLQRHGIDPEMVEFELTEIAIQKDPEALSREFHALAEAGFHLALDDFGTGYSSLELLHRLPFRKLKIDRCFVDSLLRDDVDLTIVHTSLLMARRLGLSSVAEGVSNTEQVRLLARLGCELFQSHLYSPPVSAEAFEAMLRLGFIIPNEEKP
jgi:diguanylate cyclase (GGDEF)-like protein/PAS domain S-box-containing protein